MPRLSVRPHGDHGAVAVLVVALVGGGVLLGMLALVVDIGRLLEERRELQNGADAAADALARSCAQDRPECSSTAGVGVAATIAAANAKDGLANVDSICGTPATLRPCSPPGNSIYDCAALPDGTTPFVEVRASTRSPQGGSIRALFARRDTTVTACARTAWAAPARSTGLSFTISVCEWKAATLDGTVYAPYPAVPSALYERNILLHTTAATICPAGPSGADLPGGFGWLRDSSGACETTVDAGGTYYAQPGNSTRGPCQDALARVRANRTVVFIPVYDAVIGTGANGRYHLAGFGAFVVTGYSLSGFREKSWLTGAFPCGGSDRCIAGYFVKALKPAEGELASPPGYGAQIIRPIP